MAITVLQSPSSPSPVKNENIYLVTSSNAAQSNFKYVFDLYASDGVTQLARLKRPARPDDNRCAFDVHNILKNYLSYNLGTAGEAAGFYRNSDSFYKYSIKFGEEYGDPPTVTSGLATVSNKYVWNSAFDRLSFISFDPANHKLDYGVSGGNFLTDAPASQRIELDQNAWLSMMTTTSGAVRTAQFKKYDSAGSLLGTLNITTAFYLLTQDGDRFLRLACGTKNLNAHTGSWIDSSVSYYTVQVLDSAGDASSDLFTYTITDNCRFDTVRLHFLNKYGGFDPFSFTLKSRQERTTTRASYLKRHGSSSGTTWSYSSHDRGETVFDSRVQQKFSANSDFLTEAESTWLAGLIESTEVYLELDSATLVPLKMLTTEYRPIKKQNQKLIQLFIDYQYAFENVR